MTGARGRRPRTHRGYVLAVAVLCFALAAQNLFPPRVQASLDPYDLMTIQLNEIVDQRASTLRELGVADGAVGSVLARDILATLHPALLVQQQLLSGVASQAKTVTVVAPAAPHASDRSVAPGLMLGAHLPAVPASDIAPPVSPETERTDAWRQSLLDATSLTVASAALVVPVTTGGSTYTSFTSTLPDVSMSTAPPPMSYQSLDGAEDTQPPRAIEHDGAHISLSTIAPQAAAAPQYLASAARAISPSQIALHGLVALDAYNTVARTLPIALGDVTAPTALVSAGLDTTSLITNMDNVQSTIGKYQLPLGGGSSPFSTTQTLASFIAPQVTWSFTSTTAMTDGTTLQAQGSAEADGGAVHSITLSAFDVPGAPPAVPGAPSASLSLAPDGTGVLHSVTPISGTTTLITIVRVPGLVNDPELQGALSRERLELAELSGTLQTGNALYDRLKPTYDARLAVYNKQLSAVVSRNSIIEQAWWNISQRYADYQARLAKWQQQKDAWDQYLNDRAAQPTVAPNHAPSRGTHASPSPTVEGVGSQQTPSANGPPQATAITVPTSAAGRRFGSGMAPFSSAAVVFEDAPASAPRRVVATAGLESSPSVTASPIGSDPGANSTNASATVTATAESTAVPGSGDQIAPTDATTAVASASTTPASPATGTAAVQQSTFVPDVSATDTPATASETPVDGLGSSSPTQTPISVANPSTEIPVQGTDTSTPQAVDTGTPVDQSSASATPAVDGPQASDTATPHNRSRGSATATVTPIATSVASATADTATSTATPIPTKQSSATSTPAVDGPLPTGTPGTSVSPTATGSVSPTVSVTPGTAGGSGSQSGTETNQVPTPPGPKPKAVPPPGPEPVSEPLPPPLAPLPGWFTPSITLSPVTYTDLTAHGLGPSGWANLTQEELVADGALTNIPGYQPPLRGVITTYFGGSTPWQSFHTGVDIATTDGTPVHAAAAGIVLYAGLAVPGVPTMSYGNCVVIMHNARITTLYGHMQIGQHDLQVRAGEVVTAGQVIGYEGATGWATGPHVHFEMRLNNVAFDPLLLVGVQQITG
jgi:peptidoglycan hydrolase FlgJ